MKKKIILIVVLIAVLALCGTLVFAAVNDDGGWVSPFTNILSKKIEDGTISQNEADIFNKVMEAIKGDSDKFSGMEKRAGRAINKGEWPQINKEAAEEIKTLMSEKTKEIVAGLVEEGVIDSTVLPENGLKGELKNADEETIAAVKEAFSELDEYYKSVVGNMLSAGTLTKEEADVFLKMKEKGAELERFKMNPRSFTGKMPGRCPYMEKPESIPEN